MVNPPGGESAGWWIRQVVNPPVMSLPVMNPPVVNPPVTLPQVKHVIELRLTLQGAYLIDTFVFQEYSALSALTMRILRLRIAHR